MREICTSIVTQLLTKLNFFLCLWLHEFVRKEISLNSYLEEETGKFCVFRKLLIFIAPLTKLSNSLANLGSSLT